MNTITMTPDQAITEALAEEMRRDPSVITFGEGTATPTLGTVVVDYSTRIVTAT